MGRKSCHQIAGALLVLVVFSCFAGCGSVPKASLAGNFYTYDYELLLSFTESSYLYQQSAGMRMYQDYTKTASNVVVQMQDSGFVEPDYGYLLEISPSGRISSRDNASVTGKYHDDGTFYWQGVEESGGVLRNLLVRGKLLPSRAQDRADSRYDGSFVLTDPGTGREQQVLVQDGLYFWHYAQPKEDDFEPWPLVVQPDGTIVYSLEMITRSGMVGMYDMTFSSEVYTSGSQQLQEKLEQGMGRILAGGTKSASKNLSGGGRKNPPPLWFVADLDTSTDVVAGRGMKSHEDSSVALELAEAAAVAEAISTISMTVTRESRGYETNQERRLYELVETVASRSHDYRVVNSHYDSASATAYVMVELEAE